METYMITITFFSSGKKFVGDEKLNKLERFERKMNNLYAYLEKCAA